MTRPLRHMPRPYTVFEVTIRTIQERFLLRPAAELNDLILGVLGRALQLYPNVRLHSFHFASNHFHLVLAAPDSNTKAQFMNHVDSNIAREAGRLHGWRDKFWSRRYRPIAILDEFAIRYQVLLTPLPFLKGKSEAETRAFYRDMVAEIEQETHQACLDQKLRGVCRNSAPSEVEQVDRAGARWSCKRRVERGRRA